MKLLRTKTYITGTLLLALLGAGSGPCLGADALGDFIPWHGPNGEVLPFRSDEEVLDFLRTARVVRKERLSQGINQPFKVLLEKDSVQAHAVFRDVQETKTKFEIDGELRLGFRDDYVFEVAAYELSHLLGLRLVPPTVLREIDGIAGSLQMWVESAMSEKKRRDKALAPVRPLEWARVRQIRYIFDALVFNQDRNLGNLLIDPDWQVWLIDHTRCFHPLTRIDHPERLIQISASLWAALQNTPAETVRERLVSYLREREIEALLDRWQLLQDHYAKEIERYGELRVIFSSEG